MIKDNLNAINKKIENIVNKNNIDREKVNLIAVSKTKTKEEILELYNLGIRDFGENRVKELLEKEKELPKDIRWHMIGHLQTNKVSKIIDKVEYIHSVDSVKLANFINEEAKKKDKIVKVLLELNLANEETKFGFSKEELYQSLDILSTYKNLKICGLMSVAPNVSNQEDNRLLFREIKKILVDIGLKKLDNIEMKLLSMGMSNDYEVAIEEGANFIRIGTALFGKR